MPVVGFLHHGTDPVQAGLVPSFNRPGGNVTGIGLLNWELGPKLLWFLHRLFPRAERFAVLVRPDNLDVVEPFIKEVEMAAAAVGKQIEILTARSNPDIDVAFASLVVAPRGQNHAPHRLTAVRVLERGERGALRPIVLGWECRL